MAEKEINPERIFEVVSLIKKFAKEAGEANRVINFNQGMLDGKNVELARARKAFESKQKECQYLIGLISEYKTVLLSKDQECADLKNELGILLAPFEVRLKEMRIELDELQSKYLAKLKETMMPVGCSEDACVAAAHNFVERSEKWRLYQEAAGIVKSMRECDVAAELNDNVARFWLR